ncbi:hypothetical protein BDZ89DRAFT_1141434 [Hymenopellis radicata]|nr:hypothetical protein BDZ89DRAFT_1141434 [Hymenopellis radicata]
MHNRIAHCNGEALHQFFFEGISTLEQRLETQCLDLTAEQRAHKEARDALTTATAKLAQAEESVRVMRANSSGLERALADARAYSSQLEEWLKKAATADGSSVDETYAWEKAIEQELARCNERDEQFRHPPTKDNWLNRYIKGNPIVLVDSEKVDALTRDDIARRMCTGPAPWLGLPATIMQPGHPFRTYPAIVRDVLIHQSTPSGLMLQLEITTYQGSNPRRMVTVDYDYVIDPETQWELRLKQPLTVEQSVNAVR